MRVVPVCKWAANLAILELLAELKVEGIGDPRPLDGTENPGAKFDAVSIGAELTRSTRDVVVIPGRQQPSKCQRPAVPGVQLLGRNRHRGTEGEIRI